MVVSVERYHARAHVGAAVLLDGKDGVGRFFCSRVATVPHRLSASSKLIDGASMFIERCPFSLLMQLNLAALNLLHRAHSVLYEIVYLLMLAIKRLLLLIFTI